MADGFGRVPVKAEVAATDGQVSGDSQVLIWAGTEQSAVVADAEGQGTQGRVRGAAANLAEQGEFAPLTGAR
jgi:hypothetical protein